MPDPASDAENAVRDDARPRSGPSGTGTAAAIAVLHGVGAIGWAAAMAGGFDPLHPMAWANRWIPAGIALLSLAVCVAALLKRRHPATLGAATLLGLWLGIGVAARFLFPMSAAGWWWMLAGFGVLTPWVVARDQIARRAGAVALGAVLGAAAAWMQRAPDPATHPRGEEPPPMPDSAEACEWLAAFVSDLGPVRVEADPLLRFESVSPDRFWTSLAPGDSWRGPPLRCLGSETVGGTRRAWLETMGPDPQRAFVSARIDPESREMVLDAMTQLPSPVYSHLNHAFEATLRGPDPIRLRIAGCPDDGLSPPTPGEPSRFAFVDAGGQLVVATASDLEKGPFEELCRADLGFDRDVAIEVLVRGQPVGAITLHDWATQADTTPSPTAGWGTPSNAIETWSFEEGRLVFVTATLAGTSVGRGWHSVGHAAGTYRNRVSIRSFEP